MNSNTSMIKKLRTAINEKVVDKILYNTSEFFSEEQNRPVTIYTIKKAIYNPKTKKHNHVELFHSTSQIQIVLFLRDYWYIINNIPLPVDNEKWNNIRETISVLKEKEEVK